MNPLSKNPRVPAAQPAVVDNWSVPGVRVHYYFLLLVFLSIPFRLQSMAPLKEGDQWQMWEFIRI
jgi:hypothetical protein